MSRFWHVFFSEEHNAHSRTKRWTNARQAEQGLVIFLAPSLGATQNLNEKTSYIAHITCSGVRHCARRFRRYVLLYLQKTVCEGGVVISLILQLRGQGPEELSNCLRSHGQLLTESLNCDSSLRSCDCQSPGTPSTVTAYGSPYHRTHTVTAVAQTAPVR